MKKEVVIAIILGFLVGIFIAYGIYTANKAVKETETIKPISRDEAISSSAPEASPTLTLIVDEPEENSVISDKTATISGQTEPNTPVAILAENQEELVLSDGSGIFSSLVSLVSGLNEIKVIIIDKNGNQTEKTVQIIYSTAEVE